MPSNDLIRRHVGPLAAGVALAAICAAAPTTATAQTLDNQQTTTFRSSADRALSNSAPWATGDTFRSTPASSFEPTGTSATRRNAPENSDVEPPTAPGPDTDTSEPQRRAGAAAQQDQSDPTKPKPKPPGIAKPVKPVKQYGPKKAAVRQPLPPLQPYRTAIRKRGQAPRNVLAPIEPLRPGLYTQELNNTGITTRPASNTRGTTDPNRLNPGPTVATIPGPDPLVRPPVEAKPYAPVGIGLGSLRLYPYVETDIGFDSNPDQTTKNAERASAFAHVEGGATFQSDWSRHELKGELHGGYYDYFGNSNSNRPDAAGSTTGRIDVTRDTTIDTVTRFSVSTQRPGSPEVVLGQPSADVTNRPLTYSYGGEAGGTQKFNRLSVSLRGTFDRFGYEDAKFSDGSSFPLSRNNYNQYGVKARLSYELTPAMTPYVEGYSNVRRYDSHLDSSGTARNSTGEGGRVGTTFEVSRKLTGEVSVGYENRDYVSKTLGPLKAPLVDGSIVYSATPLTTVSLKAASELDETNIPNASGAVGRRVSLELSHALMRNLVVTGLLAYQNYDYSGINLTTNTYDIGLKAEYSLSRSVVVRGSFTHERLTSATPGLDYTQNVFLLGLRLQR